jgi:hypothetical protein
MNNHVQRHFVVSTVALLSLIVGWGISLAEEVSVAGVYLLMEVNGEQLPANLWTEKLDGERCKQVILKGVLLLDSEGRSAAFLTDREFCPSEDASENGGKEQSVIFAGSYTISGDQITIEDEFGTDEAVVKGDVLLYETGGNGRPVEEFVFRKE